MSTTDAAGFLERLESDESFARELEAVKGNPNAVNEKMRAAGFDAQPEEIREAFVERYGAELTPEQLDQVAAGADPSGSIYFAAGGVVGLGVVVVGAAAAAAA